MNVDLASITATPNALHERVGSAGVNGDLIKITNTLDTGNYKLTVNNVGSSNTQGNEVLQIVETPTGNDGNFSLTHQVEAGAYEYGLRKAANGTSGWELYGAGKRTTTADASTSFINTNYLLNYIDTQTLLQRIGELRHSNASQQDGDVWMRGFGGQLNSFGGQQLVGFDMTYAGTQIGIDKRIATSSGEAYIGVMGGMTHANPNYRGGDGTTKDYHFGLYGTFIADNGFYIDAVAKYTYMKNHFSVKDTAGNSVQGKGTSDGYSASLELGKRFHLNGTPQSGGYYFEPQAQITYGYQGGMSVNATNGVRATFSNYNYTIGRASGIFGYEIASNNPVNIYFKTGYVREMHSSVSYKLNDQKQHYDFRGGWWDNGLGITAQINKKHNIYSELDYAKGSRFDQKQINVGYRYSF